MKNKKPVKILFCGDIYLKKNDYNFSSSTIDLFDKSDFVVANLEAPILTKDHAKNSMLKAGPNLFQTPQNVKKFCNTLGINYFGGANNHISDYGPEGIVSTQKYLKKMNIAFFGAGPDKKSASRYVNLFNNTVILSVAEEEFGVIEEKGWGHFSLYNKDVLNEIEKLKKSGKIVVVFGHGGGEEVPLPSKYIRGKYKELIEAGASVVVSHHPHIPQGFEKYKGGFIFYSLGNFVHDSYKESWGIVLQLELGGNSIVNTKLFAVDVKNAYVDVRDLDLKEKLYIKTINSVLNNEQEFGNLLYIQSADMFDRYYKNYFTRINLEKSKEDLLLLFVLLRNESHREFMLNALKVKSNEINFKSNLLDASKYKKLRKFITNKIKHE